MNIPVKRRKSASRNVDYQQNAIPEAQPARQHLNTK